MVGVRVVIHTGLSPSSPAPADAGGLLELPGAQPSTACVVSSRVGMSVNPQSCVALPSPDDPGAAPLWEPAPPMPRKCSEPLLAKRTASPSGVAKLMLACAGTLSVPEHEVHVGVIVIADAFGLKR